MTRWASRAHGPSITDGKFDQPGLGGSETPLPGLSSSKGVLYSVAYDSNIDAWVGLGRLFKVGGVFVSLSPDLTHWSAPQTLLSGDQERFPFLVGGHGNGIRRFAGKALLRLRCRRSGPHGATARRQYTLTPYVQAQKILDGFAGATEYLRRPCLISGTDRPASSSTGRRIRPRPRILPRLPIADARPSGSRGSRCSSTRQGCIDQCRNMGIAGARHRSHDCRYSDGGCFEKAYRYANLPGGRVQVYVRARQLLEHHGSVLPARHGDPGGLQSSSHRRVSVSDPHPLDG